MPPSPSWMQGLFRRELARLHAGLDGLEEALAPDLARAAGLVAGALRGGGSAFFCGNGGSASQAAHLATELVVKLDRERGPLRAIALGASVPLLTAAANDYGYAEVWTRELRALARSGDALVVLTTSGNSANVLRAAEAARELGVRVVGFLGRGGGRAAALCEVALVAPGTSPQRIQEVHLFLGHVLCEMVEAELLGWGAEG